MSSGDNNLIIPSVRALDSSGLADSGDRSSESAASLERIAVREDNQHWLFAPPTKWW
jgi:hypothetical protein